MARSNKGATFEREFCKSLSLWWTNGASDSVYWRTHGSGARATVRHKAGKKTHGQYGDVAAVESIGRPLTKLITFSLKRGYGKFSLVDIIDQPKGRKDPAWQEWIREAEQCAKDAGTPTWMILSQRDRREPICVYPHYTIMPEPKRRMELYLGGRELIVCRCKTFFKSVSPLQIKECVRDVKKSNT